MELFGVKFVGVNAATGHKVLLTLGFIVGVLLLRALIVGVAHFTTGRNRNERVMFWTRQGASVTAAVLLLASLLSIWFDDPKRLTTGIGIFSAGLAFALQRVVTALAGYVVIMRGNTFTVGDRITMGGVRGDVIALTFTQTKIMEMGQPPAVQAADPAMWVRSRQFTGRIVTVTNDKVFDEPVYNYTREFPFIWEEMTIPIPYRADRKRAEEILLDFRRPEGRSTGSREPAGSSRIPEALFHQCRRSRAASVLSSDGQLAGAHRPVHRPRARHSGDQGRDCPHGAAPARRGAYRNRERNVQNRGRTDAARPECQLRPGSSCTVEAAGPHARTSGEGGNARHSRATSCASLSSRRPTNFVWRK